MNNRDLLVLRHIIMALDVVVNNGGVLPPSDPSFLSLVQRLGLHVNINPTEVMRVLSTPVGERFGTYSL